MRVACECEEYIQFAILFEIEMNLCMCWRMFKKLLTIIDGRINNIRAVIVSKQICSPSTLDLPADCRKRSNLLHINQPCCNIDILDAQPVHCSTDQPHTARRDALVCK